jgi:hypothetical protein
LVNAYSQSDCYGYAGAVAALQDVHRQHRQASAVAKPDATPIDRFCRDERLAQRASWLWWVAAGEGVGAAEGIGQPVVACHVADHVRGVVAGHPGGCDIQRAAGVSPA